jgi:hypothetical protein
MREGHEYLFPHCKENGFVSCVVSVRDSVVECLLSARSSLQLRLNDDYVGVFHLAEINYISSLSSQASRRLKNHFFLFFFLSAKRADAK